MTHPVETLSEAIWHAKKANDMSAVAEAIADQAKFVHMGITFDKSGELTAFNDKCFIYQEVEVAEEKLEDFGFTVIIHKNSS